MQFFKPNAQQRRLEAILDRYRDKEDRPGAERRHLLRLWRDYIAPMRWSLALALLMNLLIASQQFVWALITRYTADTILMAKPGVAGTGVLPEFAWYHYQLIILFFAIMALMHVSIVFFTWVMNVTVVRVGRRVIFALRKALHETLTSLPLSFFDGIQTGRLLAVVIDDVSTVQQAVAGTGINAITHITTLIIGAVVLVMIDWRLALLVFIALPFYMLNFLHYRPRLRQGNITARRAVAILWAKVEEKIAAIRTLKVFGRERAETKNFAESVNNLARLNMYTVDTRTKMQAVATIITSVAIGCALYLTARAIQQGTMTLGAMLQFYATAQFLFQPANNLTGLALDIQRISVIMRRVFDLMEEDPEPIDRPGAARLPDAEGEITFDDVTFGYPGDEAATLHGVSATIPAGKQVAVMGPSGAGKSTLLYLLMRFYDPDGGGIRLDGRDLRDITLASVRERITLVMQEPVIFSGAVAENIRYGHLDATDEEVRRAAKDADLHEFILNLPDGYDTVVGERGMSLSGGQRQRLALAASLLSRPSVLLLDDTTSALDPATEARVRTTLNRIMKGRTCFVVTHRISTAMASDLVLILEDGKVVEYDTPANLLAQDGPFRRVYEQQQRESVGA
jgi:ABC-type multidrug transport system fused ATPase/permease subunit